MNDSAPQKSDKPDKYRVYTFVDRQTYKDIFRVCDAAQMPVSDFLNACIVSGLNSVNSKVFGTFKPLSDVEDLPF